MKRKRSSIQSIVEEQAQKWQMGSKEKKKADAKFQPVIYLSREPGSNGRSIAAKVAEILGFDLFDYAIIEKIAESSHMSASMVETLDERSRSALLDWISSLSEEKHLWFDDYLEHLFKIIGTIGRHGRAVVVGRGAGYIIPDCFRVRIFADMEVKMQRVTARDHLSEKEARRVILQREAEQKVYLRRYFDKDINNPRHYDLLINTDRLTVEQAAAAIVAAYRIFAGR